MTRRQMQQALRYGRFQGGRTCWPGARKEPRQHYNDLRFGTPKRTSQLNRAELTPAIRFSRNGPWILGGRP